VGRAEKVSATFPTLKPPEAATTWRIEKATENQGSRNSDTLADIVTLRLC
jgi:hypothetical protein